MKKENGRDRLVARARGPVAAVSALLVAPIILSSLPGALSSPSSVEAVGQEVPTPQDGDLVVLGGRLWDGTGDAVRVMGPEGPDEAEWWKGNLRLGR